MAGVNELSDEEYLISRALNYLKTDIATAKAWMTFAKSMFPQSFLVLFQSYKMERDQKNLAESAICLSDLVKKFPNEPSLVKELRSIADTLSSDSNEFLKAVFEKLPEGIKYDMMIAVTRNSHSIEDHCQLMLLFLKRMPNAIRLEHLPNIVKALLCAEDQPGMPMPFNLFRKILVCDALPLVLKVPRYDYKFKIVFHLLQKAIEFYISCIFAYSHSQDLAIKKDFLNFSKNHAKKGWRSLLKLFKMFALRFGWHYPEMFVSNFSELSLLQLLTLLKRKNKLLYALTSEKHTQEETSGFDEA